MKNVLWKLCDYIDKELSQGTRLHEITRHILGAFNGLHGARHFRQVLSESAHKSDAGVEVIEEAIGKIYDDDG